MSSETVRLTRTESPRRPPRLSHSSWKNSLVRVASNYDHHSHNLVHLSDTDNTVIVSAQRGRSATCWQTIPGMNLLKPDCLRVSDKDAIQRTHPLPFPAFRYKFTKMGPRKGFAIVGEWGKGSKGSRLEVWMKSHKVAITSLLFLHQPTRKQLSVLEKTQANKTFRIWKQT